MNKKHHDCDWRAPFEVFWRNILERQKTQKGALLPPRIMISPNQNSSEMH